MINSVSQGLPNYNQSYLEHYYKTAANANFTNASAQKPLSCAQKATVLATSALGMAPVMAYLAKSKGFNLNPSRILKTPIKDWALFKYEPKGKFIKYGGPQILALAASSVAGGFVGGSLVDRQNIKAKKREVMNQLLGNVLVPVGCVWAGSEVFAKYAQKLEKIMPTVKETVKGAKIINTVSKKLPQTFFTLAFLSAGIYLGNKVSNYLNDHIYHKKVDRGIKATDFAPHIDDVCMATSMMDSGSFGDKIGRVIPFALLVPGYETGTAR